MRGPDYTQTEETLMSLQGTVVFATRPDSSVYPVWINYIIGDICPHVAKLNASSPYPLVAVGAFYASSFEYLSWQAEHLARTTPRRQGLWWARSEYLNRLLNLCEQPATPPVVVAPAIEVYGDDPFYANVVPLETA